MTYEDIKEGQIINAKKYNELSLAKWHSNYDKAIAEGRNWGEMPQVAFYGFYNKFGEHRKDGFVRKTRRGSHWFKTKKEALEYRERIYC